MNTYRGRLIDGGCPLLAQSGHALLRCGRKTDMTFYIAHVYLWPKADVSRRSFPRSIAGTTRPSPHFIFIASRGTCSTPIAEKLMDETDRNRWPNARTCRSGRRGPRACRSDAQGVLGVAADKFTAVDIQSIVGAPKQSTVRAPPPADQVIEQGVPTSGRVS